MKYIIVGAVAGGASTAARLRRLDEHAEIVLFEKGEYISYANCGLPYYIGNVITDRNKLFVQTAASFNQRFKIDVRVQTEVLEVNAATKTINARNQKTGELYSENYDKFEVAICIGAGIGQTPFSSILKSMWYSLTHPYMALKLKKVIFIQISRETQVNGVLWLFLILF